MILFRGLGYRRFGRFREGEFGGGVVGGGVVGVDGVLGRSRWEDLWGVHANGGFAFLDGGHGIEGVGCRGCGGLGAGGEGV